MHELKLMDVQKKYKDKEAVRKFNYTFTNGVYGLLGENGAGKSTLMKILVTLLTPTEGTVEINGIRLERKNYELIKKEIGYLPQELGLYPNLTVRESLEYVGVMSGLKKKEYEERIDYYLDKTGLITQQRKKNRQLSGGMKRRVGLVQALLHNPRILIVDEPTTGLYPYPQFACRFCGGSYSFIFHPCDGGFSGHL